jgi:hypothetical protein
LASVLLHVETDVDRIHPLDEAEDVAMNANTPNKGQATETRATDSHKARGNAKTNPRRTGQQPARKVHAPHRRQVGATHDARPQTTNRPAARKSGSPLMKTAPSTVSHRAAPNYFTVEMALVCVGFVVAALLVILFGLDLAIARPFFRASLLMDISFTICGLLLGYLSWNAYRDLV